MLGGVFGGVALLLGALVVGLWLLAGLDLAFGLRFARLLLLGALNWTSVWYRDKGSNLDPLVRAAMSLLGVSEERQRTSK